MRSFVIPIAALAALASSVAFADDAKMTTPAMATPATATSFVTLQSGDMLSSKVVGLDVRNSDKTDIGKIEHIAFDSSKKVNAYILSVGGFLGMGTHYVAVDPASVSVTYDGTDKVWRATMNATKAELKAAPEFKYEGEWTASKS